MRSHNPALKSFNTHVQRTGHDAAHDKMTIQGTTNKIGILFLLAMLTAALTWSAGPELTGTLTVVGLIGGLIFAMITIFKSGSASVTAPIYALFEGLFLGGISISLNSLAVSQGIDGIITQAIALTFAIFFTMLYSYKAGIIKPTKKFKSGVIAATGGIFLLYFATFILGLFGINLPYIHSAGPIGIGISGVIVIIAALNLIIDFDMIEKGEKMGAPKNMEWYAAFGLMVTLVWLYLEVLRLLWLLYSFFDD